MSAFTWRSRKKIEDDPARPQLLVTEPVWIPAAD
jgi:hypothetical protein